MLSAAFGLIAISSRYVSSEGKDEKWQEYYGRSHGMRTPVLAAAREVLACSMACVVWAARVMVASIYNGGSRC